MLPHQVPDAWRRGDDGGGGVVAKPDRLVTFETLSSERVQQVHLSLEQKKKKEKHLRQGQICITGKYMFYKPVHFSLKDRQ